MTDLRKAAEMALEKLDHLWEIGVDISDLKTDVLPEIQALRQALAQQEQEPVAWINGYGFWKYKPKGIDNLVPLYTAPPKHEWIGLTDEELLESYGWIPAPGAPDFILNGAKQELLSALRKVEAKLKEKNNAA